MPSTWPCAERPTSGTQPLGRAPPPLSDRGRHESRPRTTRTGRHSRSRGPSRGACRCSNTNQQSRPDQSGSHPPRRRALPRRGEASSARRRNSTESQWLPVGVATAREKCHTLLRLRATVAGAQSPPTQASEHILTSRIASRLVEELKLIKRILNRFTVRHGRSGAIPHSRCHLIDTVVPSITAMYSVLSQYSRSSSAVLMTNAALVAGLILVTAAPTRSRRLFQSPRYAPTQRRLLPGSFSSGLFGGS